MTVIGCPTLYAGLGLYVAAASLGVAFAVSNCAIFWNAIAVILIYQSFCAMMKSRLMFCISITNQSTGKC